ncbi:MAG TPA: hypothetical protein VNO30_00445 [Kofleriaceae bacterium]|nr:hypothetical protein [Kofleriaceae bacterium]
MSARPQLLVVVTACVVLAAARADANMGQPWRGGSRAGEPEVAGEGISAVRIAREELVIDLRPLADDGLAAVTATYHLDNPADARHLDLVFAAGSDAADFRVALDGRPVPLASPWGTTLPASWGPPASTPDFDGGELTYHLKDNAMPARFSLDVPPGRHDLAVSYRADAVRYYRGEPTIVRQLAYVLSPARTWAGFGGLDVTVHVPPGWRAAVVPAMPRAGDTLRAAFPAVPADAIALTVQAPAGAHGPLRIATLLVLVLVVVGGGFVVARWTRARERRRSPAISALKLAALGRGIVWGLAVLGACLLAIFGPDLALADGQADHRGYGRAFAILGAVLASMAIVVIGTIVAIVAGNGVHEPPRTEG